MLVKSTSCRKIPPCRLPPGKEKRKREKKTHKPNALLHKHDPQFLARGEDVLVRLAAGGAGDVRDARTAGAQDVVDEGELYFAREGQRAFEPTALRAEQKKEMIDDDELTKASEDTATPLRWLSHSERSSGVTFFLGEVSVLWSHPGYCWVLVAGGRGLTRCGHLFEVFLVIGFLDVGFGELACCLFFSLLSYRSRGWEWGV